MKFATLTILCLTVVLVNCDHTFLGTNVQRQLVYHKNAKLSSNFFTKRMEVVNYTIPSSPYNNGRSIQGILAYDLTNSSASCDVTAGGLGMSFVSLQMKSAAASSLNYDIYIYA